jgi:succinate dehydrogenase / fumarate reductase, cytochrome b subunit
MGVLEKNHFLLRKLHSLSGLLPVGLFLLEHFFTNAHALQSPEEFNSAAAWIDSLPLLPILELTIILPLFYHAFFGLYIALFAKNTLPRYTFERNWAFYAQRATGVLTLIFVLWHLIEFRGVKLLGQLGFAPKLDITYDVVAAGNHLGNNFIFAFYLIAIVGTAYHFANGMWAFLIDWGITIGPKAQKFSLTLMMGLFVIVSTMGVGAAFGFRGVRMPLHAENPTSNHTMIPQGAQTQIHENVSNVQNP